MLLALATSLLDVRVQVTHDKILTSSNGGVFSRTMAIFSKNGQSGIVCFRMSA